MDVICVKEKIKNASDYPDGDIIFEIINDYLSKDESIAISFEGIAAVTSAFINSALIRLLEHHSFEKIKSLLKIVNSTKMINETIIERFDFVSKQGANLYNQKNNKININIKSATSNK